MIYKSDMMTFKEYITAIGEQLTTVQAPAYSSLQRRYVARRKGAPPSPYLTPQVTLARRMANWEMQTLNMLLDIVEDAEHAPGNTKIIVGQDQQGRQSFYFQKSDIDRNWHHQAIDLLRSKGIAAKEETPEVVDVRDGQTYYHCYQIFPEQAESVLNSDTSRYNFIQEMEKWGRNIWHYATQASVTPLPGTTLMGR